MKFKAIMGGVVALLAGVIIFALIQVSSIDKRGVRVGTKSAAACSKEKAESECLPALEVSDVDGTFYTPDFLAGKVVMVNFWATWCAPCLAEIPALSKVYEKHAMNGFVLLGVMTDFKEKAQAESFALSVGLNYPIVPMSDPILEAFEYPEGIPTTIIYDRGGNQRFYRRGGVGEAELDEIIAELTAEQPADLAAATTK